MAGSVWSWLTKPSLIRTLVLNARLAARLLRDPAVGWAPRAIPVLALLYIVSPIDVVPDVLPILGELDDLGLLFLAVQAFIHVCPGLVVEYHRAALASRRAYTPMPPTPTAQAGPIIDAEFRHKD